MGTVYKAKDLRLLRAVAIKFLSPHLLQETKALKRFQQEAITASAINHPNICVIYEVDSLDNEHFIVMEYVDGKNLSQILMEQGSLAEERVVEIIRQTAEALIASHDVGIIHRDIKPSNIVIYEKSALVKVMDFGLAKLISETAESLVSDRLSLPTCPETAAGKFVPSLLTTTLTGLMGTAYYMSPEQVKQEPIDHRTDIFSLGIVAYELLTGNQPFVGETQTDVLQNILSRKPISILTAKPGINKAWQPIFDKALEKDKNLRYQSVKDFVNDIEKIKKRSGRFWSSISDTRHQKESEKERQRKALLFIGAVCLLIVIVLIVYFSKTFFIDNETTTAEPTVSPLDRTEATTDSDEAYRYFLEGRKAWWRYDNSKAINYFQMAVQIDTSFVYANALLAVLLRWIERNDESDLCLHRVASCIGSVSDWEKLLAKGFVAYGRGENEKMAEYFMKLIEKYPDKIDGYFGAALAFEKLSDYDKAIEVTKQILKIDSCHIAAYGNLAEQFENKGNLEQGIKFASKEVELFEASAEQGGIDGAYELLGRIFHKQGEEDSAISYLEKSLLFSPGNLDAVCPLAEAYALSGRIDKAEQLLNHALTLPVKVSERANTYGYHAALMVFSGRFVDAISSYNKSKNLFVDCGYYWGVIAASDRLCQLYTELGQFELAEKEWQDLKLMTTDKPNVPLDDVERVELKLKLYFSFGRCDYEAVPPLLKEMQARYTSRNRFYKLFSALFAASTGRFDEAANLLHRTIPDSNGLWTGRLQIERYHLSVILADQEKYAEAIPLCRQALKTRQIISFYMRSLYYIKTLMLLSEIYEKLGQYDNAKKCCEQFFVYWQHADADLPQLNEMKNRWERLNR